MWPKRGETNRAPQMALKSLLATNATLAIVVSIRSRAHDEDSVLHFDSYLNAVAPLAILYSHSSADEEAPIIYGELRPIFLAEGLDLLMNPFVPGQDVNVAMARLNTNAVILYCTAASQASAAVATELTSARQRGAPIGVVTSEHSPPLPEALARRIVCRWSRDPATRRSDVSHLAREVAERARTHWTVERLAKPGFDAEEREAGAEWLCGRDPQVLAEFLARLAALHLREDENPSVGYWLATALGRTGLPEAVPHLKGWQAAARRSEAWGAVHPNVADRAVTGPTRLRVERPAGQEASGDTQNRPLIDT